jgi:hypothetical protein
MKKNNTPYIASRTSPQGSSRACLCWDTNTYSISCCDGSVRAQGIGVITRTATIDDEEFLLQEDGSFLLQEDSSKIIL